MEGMVAIEETLCDVAGHLNAQHARLVDLTVELLANEQWWSGPGVWRADQFLAWKTGIAPARARQIVEVAERVEELPECVDAFRRGELAVDQMAAIAKRAPWWTDAEICALGKMMTVRQLRGVLARYPFPDIPRPGSEPVAEEEVAESTVEATADHGGGDPDPVCGCVEHADRCSFFFDDDGRFHLSVDTDRLTGSVLQAALVEARDRLFHDGHAEVTWTDALREVAERSLDSITDPARRDRYRINVHIDQRGGAVDATGWRLPDAIRRYLTCDGLLSPVFTDGGVPVSVGRSQRIVPDRTRRLVVLRDQGCRVPGCTEHRFLEVHHIIHWDDHGPTDTWNLICICPHHHRLHHQGKLGIGGNADEPGSVVFTNQAGNPIAQSGARPKPPGAPPSPPIGTYRHPLGERLEGRWLCFNPPAGARPTR